MSSRALLKRVEPVGVVALLLEPAVEGLDEGVLGRFARADEVEVHAAVVGPAVERFEMKAGPLST
jgi:hypothetical protein